MQAIKFKNYTDEDFTWNFDSIPYTFAAGQEIFLEDYKAFFFAKHLADRECNKAGIPTNDPRRAEFEAKCIATDEAISPVEALDLNEKKKVTKKAKKVEEEFPDLNDD